jgi:ATP-dependent Clp protease ATP-binding subunit ClpX
MVRILTEPKDALIRQFQALFKLDGVSLIFEDEALRAIGREASTRPTGARALRSIVTKILKPFAYDIPSDPEILEICVTKDLAEGKGEALLTRKARSEPES